MVLLLFVLSFSLALGVAWGMGRICRDVSEPFLCRFFAQHPSLLAAKYLQFIVIVVGVISGARIRLLEDYAGAPSWNQPELSQQLTPEFWAVALYHTFIDTLLGILWLLVALSFLTGMTYFFARRSKMARLLSERERERIAPAEPSQHPATPARRMLE
ncbi:MAG TPA: hypothetical protein VMJ35_07470 [Dongiaceae bacterium]|nr:hypothetical protein [Dongiaceae bacterium]